MYEVKWMPKTAAELEELCNKAVEHGFELVACNDKFCVFKSAQHSVEPTRSSGEAIPGVVDEIEELWAK